MQLCLFPPRIKTGILSSEITGRQTNVVVDFSVDVAVQTTSDRVQIVTPDTSLFEIPIYNIGDTILLSGIATTDAVCLLL